MAYSKTTLRGLHYRTGRPVQITVEQGRIAGVEDADAESEPKEYLPWIGPGLFDLQINGYGGMDFNTYPLTVQTVSRITRALWKEGVTGYFPTVITNADHTIREAVSAIAKACREDEETGRSVAGIHLEGPFISPRMGRGELMTRLMFVHRIGPCSSAGRRRRRDGSRSLPYPRNGRKPKRLFAAVPIRGSSYPSDIRRRRPIRSSAP
ncbi:hypothetical protein LJK87_13995 [Paenibacillus sp. P25]|nr:hypothetical protein LJK87_13995 [Paenibacillus sp. P25]